MESLEPRLLLDGQVIINEIHYDSPVKTQPDEFIELYNRGTTSVDLSGWRFSDAVEYTFPAGTFLGAGQYLVIAQNPATVQAKWGVASLGPWTGRLDNDGDNVVLRNAQGGREDEVEYRLGFPWPTVGDQPGYSIELVNPSFDNDLGGNWRSHAPPSTAETTLIAAGSQWSYRKGTSAASSPIGAWRQLGFTEDGTWLTGTTPVGYDASLAMGTYLGDMRQTSSPPNPGYASVYMRKMFYVENPAAFGGLRLEVQYDDGFNAWINGTRVAWSQVSKEDMLHSDLASSPARESNNFDTFLPPSPAAYLQAGWNVLAAQFHNVSLGGSSDAFFNARLIATPGGGASPTPGARNSVYADNAAPQMRQVSHTPDQPAAGEAVTITVKVTDPDGVASVVLEYQVVEPGAYVELADAAYQTNWTSLVMRDDGTGGDAQAGDSVYTVRVPAGVQVHRRLIRYRITATDGLGLAVRAPYDDDPQPNFAYFVYNGLPSWSGAIQPGSADPAKAQVVTYGADVLGSLPVYTLLTKRTSHVDSQYIPNSTGSQYGGDAYPWSGTLVYDGRVYDHIHFRARGGVWRYAMGKNMWKFDFNRGHSFEARDDYGRPYDIAWSKLNLGACIQQGNYWHRGEQGLFEAVGFRLFNLLGVEASNTAFVHFRIIDQAAEAGPTQYDGDFRGLYLATEQMDGRFLDEHDLPDGNLYKMEGGTGAGGGDLNNQGPTQPSDNSDLVAFTNTYLNTTPSDDWWRQNFDLDRYYSYRAVVEGIHHYDIGYGKNYFYYHNPDTGVWSVHPWDLDLTWANNMYGNGASPFRDRVLPRAAFNVDYQNRLREFRDLLYNPGELGRLIDEMAARIDTPADGASFVDADRAMWDYNPILISSYVNSSKAGHGRFYAGYPSGGIVIPAPGGFRGMVQLMKNYVASRGAWIDSTLLTDTTFPATPTLTYVGGVGYPINRLSLVSSAFSSPAGRAFAAIEWRLAEVTDPSAPAYDPSAPGLYEITPVWESGELSAYNLNLTIPASAAQVGHAYRARVRFKDAGGRWSQWSNAVQFVAGLPIGTPPDDLRITEIMYHPAEPTVAERAAGYTDKELFEFLEFQNVGRVPINLSGVHFHDGIEFAFSDMTLLAGARVLVVKNQGAFLARYGANFTIAGAFTSGSLDNAGERIHLVDAADGTILDFAYDDDWYEHTDGEGFSLVVRDSAQAPDLWNAKSGWRASWLALGNPGQADPGVNPGTIVVNEVLAHTDAADGDWIELYNTGPTAVNIGGWYLSDDPSSLLKYRILAGTTIPGYGYAVFTQAAHFGGAFALSELGEAVYVTSSLAAGVAGGYRESESFGASDREVTLGRHLKSTGGKDFVALSAATRGTANAYPVVGPVALNEVLYAPGAGGDEYIELYNLTGSAVALYDPLRPANRWKFTQGVTFEFPGEASIPAYGYALVVGIDPAVFRAKYGVPAAVPIYGPYTGALDNAGETVELCRPGDPEPGTGLVPYYRVDRLTYSPSAPWPEGPASGSGASLERESAVHYGNDVINWGAGPVGGTPGAANTVAPPRVTTVRLNSRDVRGASGIDPSGAGVRTIDVTFSEAVTFSAADVVVQTVTVAGGVVTVTGTITPASVMGSGTTMMTVTLPAGAAVDTWVKVTLAGSGMLRNLSLRRLDGEARPGGSGVGYVLAAGDLPTGDGLQGGDTVFYVGSLRGDFDGDRVLTVADVDAFLVAYGAANLDADFRGVGFGAAGPDGQVTRGDMAGFASVYQAAVAAGRGLGALPGTGGGAAGPAEETTGTVLAVSAAPRPVQPGEAAERSAAPAAAALLADPEEATADVLALAAGQALGVAGVAGTGGAEDSTDVSAPVPSSSASGGPAAAADVPSLPVAGDPGLEAEAWSVVVGAVPAPAADASGAALDGDTGLADPLDVAALDVMLDA